MEIEFLPAPLQPLDIAQRIYGTIGYLLVKGAVLKDGDTLGQSPSETIRVHFKDRSAHFSGRVLQLTYERNAPASPPLPGMGGTPYSAAPCNGRKRAPFGKRGRG
ncbi:DUF4261 domain-containing protein [Breoghania sp. L-A4]|uniref:DUF4261 domain-containing protein n=1 Tax=Breoghania sp. L-A4 TaxID=2304600 RepID=UPI000E35E94F|nr:DUF4261 domain-containing protein [Breoghania sp. L-A4]AXS39482.1 DUF4261 domain-containing protein [Breoghania sp. L-A4]